jgi:hypothetical protein
VANYRHWGSVAHKVESYIGASYINTMGEDIYASLHPNRQERKKLKEFYSSKMARMAYDLNLEMGRERPSKLPEGITYQEIAKRLLERIRGNDSPLTDFLNNWPVTDREKKIYATIDSLSQWEAGLRTLTGKTAPYAQFVPNVVHLRLGKEHLYTLYVDRGLKNNKIVNLEKFDRKPEEDIVRAVKGLIGPFPHLFIDLEWSQSATFLRELRKIESLEAWIRFADHYKVPRNSDKFWPFVDWLHEWIGQNMKEEGALLDLRNYDIRDKPY